MDQKKLSIHFLPLLLLLLCVLPLDAVPLSRSLALRNHGATAIKVADQAITGERLGEKEAFVNGRMDIEFNDYPGPGANNHHDPRTPGRP